MMSLVRSTSQLHVWVQCGQHQNIKKECLSKIEKCFFLSFIYFLKISAAETN